MAEKWVYQILADKGEYKGKWVTVGEEGKPFETIVKAQEYSQKATRRYNFCLGVDVECERLLKTKGVQEKKNCCAEKVINELFPQGIMRWESEGETKPGAPDWQIYQMGIDGKKYWYDAYLNYIDKGSGYPRSVLSFLREHGIEYKNNWEKAIDEGLKRGLIRSRIPAGKEELEEYTEKKPPRQVFEDAITQAGSHKAKVKIGENLIFPIDEDKEYKEGFDNKFLKEALSYAPGKGLIPVLSTTGGGVLLGFGKMKFNFEKYLKKEGKEVLKPLPMMSSMELGYLMDDIDKIQKELQISTIDQLAWDCISAVPFVGNIAALLHIAEVGISALRAFSSLEFNKATKKINIGTTLPNDPDWELIQVVLSGLGVIPLFSTFSGLLSAAARAGAYDVATGYLSSFRTVVKDLLPEAREQEKEGLNAAIRKATWEEAEFSIDVWRQYNLLVDTTFEDVYYRDRDIEDLKQPYLEYMPDDPFAAVKQVNTFLVSQALVAPTPVPQKVWGMAEEEEDSYINEILKPYLMFPLQLLEINSGRYYIPAFKEYGGSGREGSSQSEVANGSGRVSNQMEIIQHSTVMPPSLRLPTGDAKQDMLIKQFEKTSDQPLPGEFYLTGDDWSRIERDLNKEFGPGPYGGKPYSIPSGGESPQSYNPIPITGYGEGFGFSSYTPADLGFVPQTPAGWDGAMASGGYFLGGLKQLVAGQGNGRGDFSPALDLGAFLLAPFKNLIPSRRPSAPGERGGKLTERLFQIPQMILTASPLGPLFAAGGTAGNLLSGLSEPQPQPQVVYRFEQGSVQIHTQKISPERLGNVFIDFLRQYSQA